MPHAARLALLVVAGLIAAALPPADAQQFPAQQRGLTADTAYQSGELDNVNLFNGNLSLTIPLGQPYPAGPSFSLGFALHYNSKVWDYEEKVCQQTIPPAAIPYNLPVPDKYANAGLGWLLTPGRLLDPSTPGVPNPLNLGPNWVYVSADGGHHALYPRLHPGYPATPSASGTLYSNDGTYLRQKVLGSASCRSVAGTSGACRIVEFPDGSRNELLSFGPFNWRVVRMQDSFGNQVDIDYEVTAQGADHQWTFTDPHGRSQVVDFENGRVRYLRLEAFGDTTAIWEFQYTTTTIPRHRYTQLSCNPAAPTENVAVTFLMRLVRPDLSYFDFAYNTTDLNLSGAINFLRYPTGGSLAWTYQTYAFPHEDPSVIDGPSAKSAGVATKTMANTDGTVVGTWDYDVLSIGIAPAPGNHNSPCYHRMTLTDPLGQVTEHFFSAVENIHHWAYGFLTRSRQLAGTVPQAFDVLTVNLKNTAGYLTSQRFFGGDGGNLPTSYNSLCEMADPVGDPQFRIDHGWSAGSLASSQWVDPCDSSAVLSVVDATIDSGTGLPSIVRDAAGLATTLVYDSMSRLVEEQPEEGAWRNTVYQFPTVGVAADPSVETESCTYGESACSGTSRGSSRYKTFDGLGRLTREALALPVEGDPDQNQTRKFTYNALGWKLTESTWQEQKNTTFSAHDRFGRVGFIQPPGSSGIGIGLTYKGERRSHRQTKIETTGGLVDNWVTEERDHFGRLIAVCEAQTSLPGSTGCGGLETRYSYDAADRLIGVCSRPNGASCGQSRSFYFDGRGFLTGETHPELGPSGNGTASYQYDALGHTTHSQIDGSADFELRSRYDAAGRLVRLEQKSGAEQRPLKEFFYARDSDGIGWQGGKLVLAKRHNWVNPIAPMALGNIDAVIMDEYRYEGTAGRPSRKTTTFRLGASTNAFESSYQYDDFGNLTSIAYPEPLSWPFSRFRQPRQVNYGYTLGFLSSVEGYATAITYQLGGMLHQIDYAGGATWTQNFNTADHLPRPYNITLSAVTAGFATGNFFYDGQSNISQIGNLLYRYDRLGRLVRGDTPNGAGIATQTAAFDDFGNLKSLVTGGSTQTLTTQESTNHLTGVDYDAAGSVTKINLGSTDWEYNFDGLRKMISLHSSSNQARIFFYDANDERIFAWDCPQSSCEPDHNLERWTLRGLGGEVLRSYAGGEKFTTTWEEDFIYRGGGALLASIRPSGTPNVEDRRYAAVDHLGSVRLIWNGANQTLDRFDFYPFGQEVGSVAAGDPPLKFTGHERDANGSGKGMLDYMHARYCSPITARFLSVDPVLGRPGLPQSWNRFSYALNNPIKFTDPNGEQTSNQIAEGVQADIRDLKHDVVEFGFDVLPTEGAVVFAFLTGSALDLGSTLLEPLRFGDAVGSAVGSDAGALEMTLAIAQDAGRGLALVSAAGGLVGKASGAAGGQLFSQVSSGPRATPALIEAVQKHGRVVTIAREGSEELRYLNAMGAEANVGGPGHLQILLRENPSKAAVLEEFLHGTQSRLGIIDRLGVNGAENHVASFMQRHAKLLGLE